MNLKSSLLLGIFFAMQAQAEVVVREIDYQQGDTIMKGMVAYDDAIKEKRPGVLIVHEW